VRALLTCTGGFGHLEPMLPFADALLRMGAEVRVVAPENLISRVTDRGLRGFAVPAPDPERSQQILRQIGLTDRYTLAKLVDGELFGRLATRAALPYLRTMSRSWTPDLILREPCDYAGAILAQELGCTFATVAISAAGNEHSVLDLVAEELPGDGAAVVTGIRAAPYLTRLAAPLDPSEFTHTVRYRPPPMNAEPLPDWWPGQQAKPLVYLTYGTVTSGSPLARSVYPSAIAALAELDARVLLTTGPSLDPERFGALPPSFVARRWVDQKDVMADASAVVCHGGSGTVHGALAAGVPLVIQAFFADQLHNAVLIPKLGLGLSVDRDRPSDLLAAARNVLDQPSFAAAVSVLAGEMSAYPEASEVLPLVLAP
jgi:UDP:flavonoid glycosyltransferase YjiC (YdhE family)